MKSKRIYFIATLLLTSATGILSCAMSPNAKIPLAVKLNEADLLFERAEGLYIRFDNEYNRKSDLKKRAKIYDKALKSYRKVIKADSNGGYAQQAYWQIAEIHKKRYEWHEVSARYQEIAEIDPTSYLGQRARRAIDEIAENRQTIDKQLTLYGNTENLEEAAEALYHTAAAYEVIGDYPEAIRFYQKLLDEFPDHPLAPKAAYQIGAVYFYKLYDYSDAGGWGAFVRVVEKFPDSDEAEQAKNLLKTSEQHLKAISKSWESLAAYKNWQADNPHAHLASGSPTVHYYQSIANGWIQMKNPIYAIAAYREMMQNLTDERFAVNKKFAVIDALHQIGLLYQNMNRYHAAIRVYDTLLAKESHSTWHYETLYQQGLCYRAVGEEERAYQNFKAYLHGVSQREHYHDTQRIVREMEQEQAGGGY
jgi:tetratricopeptide (TPR) repeat protein